MSDDFFSNIGPLDYIKYQGRTFKQIQAICLQANSIANIRFVKLGLKGHFPSSFTLRKDMTQRYKFFLNEKKSSHTKISLVLNSKVD